MGVFPAFNISSSAMNNAANSIQVVGDNIANLSTPGFKRSRALTTEAFPSMLVGGNVGEQVGNGANSISIQRTSSQGSVLSTGNPLDVAINGKGNLILRDPATVGYFYTRDGNLDIDNALNLIHKNSGHRVQGFAITNGVPSTTLSDIVIPSAGDIGQATTSLAVQGLLDSDANVLGTPSSFDSAAKKDEFTVVLGVNDQIRFRLDQGPVRTASLITDGGLTSGTPINGTALASAIKQAIEAQNASTDTYAVSYDQKTDTFSFSNPIGNAAELTLLHEDPASTASSLLGFVASPQPPITVGQTQESDFPVAFNVVAGVNDALTATIDGISVSITVPPGVYTGKDLAFAIQRAITNANPQLAAAEVAYEGPTSQEQFRLLAPRTGEAYTISQPSNTGTPSIAVPAIGVSVTGGTLAATTGWDTGAYAQGAGFFDASNPFTTSNANTNVEVIDGLGQKRNMTLFFRKVGDSAWEWHAAFRGADLLGPTPPTAFEEVASGLLRFTSDGKLDRESLTTGTGVVNFDGLNGGPPPPAGQVINFDFGDAITTDGGTGELGMRQFASSSAPNDGRNALARNRLTVNNIDNNGIEAGTFTEASIDSDGYITAHYSNGQNDQLAQIAIGMFPAPTELNGVGDNLFIETGLSGTAILTTPGLNGGGDIVVKALENSNTELATEFTDLIFQQQIFQANAKVVSTSDRMLESLSRL